ncbi:MAG: DUF547 domain-containing protein [Leptolyngbyaceae cyanobacterium SM2_5_2]|nr:DUF547 domain-containing protein [Leptolyngbyaceae cyanobacterium SM2_5_2]
MFHPRSFMALSAIVLLSGCASAPISTQGHQTPSVSASTADSAAPLVYDDYARILETYVDDNGLVDYPGLQANPEPLKAFIAQLGAVSPATYEGWEEAEQIAFLINAYNAITLESIIAQEPLKNSIRDIVGVWNFKQHQVKGQSLTLDAIEHDILRQDFVEPRIHAALVCAAISCPPLRREPYTGAALDAQLEEQVQQWLAGPHGLDIDRNANRVAISAIFDWFGEDWKLQYSVEEGFTGTAKQRATLNFISQYLSAEDQNYLLAGDYKLEYLPYDWSLNRQP